ncbi:MAG: hypothetical protein HOB41_00350 [Gemmatimonadetes bacterium]|jgi:hypothetical protein|nr:hypothetical protein [Gemmatimonadota bacterium]MBT5448536.1 hypothetical protein [Gemmatimonadota bacterium]MBT6618309.1 hypothetical protein [Gemmatimonadota bacterium]
MSALDWVVIAAYLAATIGLGLWLSRKWSNLLGAGLSIIAVFVRQIPYRGRLALVYRARDLGDGRCRAIGANCGWCCREFCYD